MHIETNPRALEFASPSCLVRDSLAPPNENITPTQLGFLLYFITDDLLGCVQYRKKH
jgi:hypothetical protein